VAPHEEGNTNEEQELVVPKTAQVEAGS